MKASEVHFIVLKFNLETFFPIKYLWMAIILKTFKGITSVIYYEILKLMSLEISNIMIFLSA